MMCYTNIHLYSQHIESSYMISILHYQFFLLFLLYLSKYFQAIDNRCNFCLSHQIVQNVPEQVQLTANLCWTLAFLTRQNLAHQVVKTNVDWLNCVLPDKASSKSKSHLTFHCHSELGMTPYHVILHILYIYMIFFEDIYDIVDIPCM